MVTLLWALLNTAFWFYFIYLLIGFIFIKSKVFPQKFKTLSKSVFAIGFVGILISATSKERKSNTLYSPLSEKIIKINIKKGASLSVNGVIELAQKDNKWTVKNEKMGLTGMVMGFHIKNNTVLIKDSTYTYKGDLEWKFLNIPIFTEKISQTGSLE